MGLGGAGAESPASGNTNPFPGSLLLLQTALVRQPGMAAPSGCPKGWMGPEVMLGQSTRSQNSPTTCLGSSSPPRTRGDVQRGHGAHWDPQSPLPAPEQPPPLRQCRAPKELLSLASLRSAVPAKENLSKNGPELKK